MGYKTWGHEKKGPIMDINEQSVVHGYCNKLDVTCIGVPCEGDWLKQSKGDGNDNITR